MRRRRLQRQAGMWRAMSVLQAPPGRRAVLSACCCSLGGRFRWCLTGLSAQTGRSVCQHQKVRIGAEFRDIYSPRGWCWEDLNQGSKQQIKQQGRKRPSVQQHCATRASAQAESIYGRQASRAPGHGPCTVSRTLWEPTGSWVRHGLSNF